MMFIDMKMLPILFVIFVLLVSYQEAIQEVPSGKYVLNSCDSGKAMDINGNGHVSTNFLSQLNLDEIGENEFFLFLAFSNVTFFLPNHSEQNSTIIIDKINAGREMKKGTDGKIFLSWLRSANPIILSKDIEVISFRMLEKKPNNLELIVNQRWYDHSQSNWEDSKVTYVFSKR